MDIATSVKPDELPWWKERFLPANHRLHCRIGPLTADIFRGSGEWLLGWESGEEGDSRDAQLELLEGVPEQEMVERFIFKRITGRLRLKPRLLDRHLVSRPRQPLYLPPGEATTLYVSSPVTVNIEVEQPGVSLRELPTVRLSDTWFGPSTRDGELCYASLTSARSHLTEVPDRPHRAIRLS